MGRTLIVLCFVATLLTITNGDCCKAVESKDEKTCALLYDKAKPDATACLEAKPKCMWDCDGFYKVKSKVIDKSLAHPKSYKSVKPFEHQHKVSYVPMPKKKRPTVSVDVSTLITKKSKKSKKKRGESFTKIKFAMALKNWNADKDDKKYAATLKSLYKEYFSFERIDTRYGVEDEIHTQVKEEKKHIKSEITKDTGSGGGGRRLLTWNNPINWGNNDEKKIAENAGIIAYWDTGAWHVWCTGTVLPGKAHVLTAGHCVLDWDTIGTSTGAVWNRFPTMKFFPQNAAHAVNTDGIEIIGAFVNRMFRLGFNTWRAFYAMENGMRPSQVTNGNIIVMGMEFDWAVLVLAPITDASIPGAKFEFIPWWGGDIDIEDEITSTEIIGNEGTWNLQRKSVDNTDTNAGLFARSGNRMYFHGGITGGSSGGPILYNKQQGTDNAAEYVLYGLAVSEVNLNGAVTCGVKCDGNMFNGICLILAEYDSDIHDAVCGGADDPGFDTLFGSAPMAHQQLENRFERYYFYDDEYYEDDTHYEDDDVDDEQQAVPPHVYKYEKKWFAQMVMIEEAIVIVISIFFSIMVCLACGCIVGFGVFKGFEMMKWSKYMV